MIALYYLLELVKGGKSNDKRNSAANTAGGGRSNSLRADPFAKFSKIINIESFIGIGVRIFYFVKSKREIKKTIDYLHP